MSFTIWMGLHGVMAEDFETAEEAHRAYLDFEARGGKYLQIMEGAREVPFGELAARVGGLAE
jgi:hypothetical protein